MGNIIGRMGTSGGFVGKMGGSTSKALEQKINEVDSRVDTIITTPVDGVSAQEIIDARDGAVTLGANITEIKSQLAETAKVVNVKKFGAKGDGVTDDYQPLLQAKNYAITNKGILYIPNDMNCYIGSNLDLTGIKEVDIKGRVSGAVGTVVTLGHDSVLGESTTFYVNDTRNITLKIHAIMNGLNTINFADHLLLFADGNNAKGYALAYSRFNLGRIKKLEINSVAGTKSAWINENKFFGGRVDELYIGGSYTHNNNKFYGTMFEGFTANIENGKFNHFYDCRLEGTCNITFGQDTTHNYFYRSYSDLVHDYLRTIDYSTFITVVNNGFDNGVFSTADNTHKRDVVFEINPKSNNFDLSIFNKYDDYLTVNSLYKIVFDTGLVELKSPLGFWVSSDVSLFTVFIFAYDANKQLITTEQTHFTNLLGGLFNATNHYYSFNGALTGSSKTSGFPIYPNPNIKYFRITVNTGAGTFGSSFKYLKVIKTEQNNRFTNVKSITDKDSYYSNAVPTKGVWNVGEKVVNSEPTTGEYVGWVCVTTGDFTGTPPVFKGYGLIS